MKTDTKTALDQLAGEAREAIEDDGGRAMIFMVSIKETKFTKNPRVDVDVTRSFSSSTTPVHAKAYIEALQREITRVGGLIGGL